jgi:hypothetical protein
MERASTIYLYTSTPPLTCDGRREDKSTRAERQRGSGRPGAAGGCGELARGEEELARGEEEFRINCEKPGFELETWGSDTMLRFMH